MRRKARSDNCWRKPLTSQHHHQSKPQALIRTQSSVGPRLTSPMMSHHTTQLHHHAPYQQVTQCMRNMIVHQIIIIPQGLLGEVQEVVSPVKRRKREPQQRGARVPDIPHPPSITRPHCGNVKVQTQVSHRSSSAEGDDLLQLL